MPFKDRLIEIFSEHGGLSTDNIERICQLARQFVPDLSPKRMVLLLRGMQASPEEIHALAATFGVSEAEFIDDPTTVRGENKLRIRKVFTDRLNRADLIGEGEEYIESQAYRRNIRRVLTFEEINKYVSEFMQQRYLGEETR